MEVAFVNTPTKGTLTLGGFLGENDEDADAGEGDTFALK